MGEDEPQPTVAMEPEDEPQPTVTTEPEEEPQPTVTTQPDESPTPKPTHKLKFIRLQLMKMSSKMRGPVLTWLKGAPSRSAFQKRTAQLIPILQSPSKMALLTDELQAATKDSSSDSDSDTESHSRSNKEKDASYARINFISSKLMKMSPETRGAVQSWLQEATEKSVFQSRTAQLVQVLRSPSMTAELTQWLRRPSTENLIADESQTQAPEESPTQPPGESPTQTMEPEDEPQPTVAMDSEEELQSTVAMEPEEEPRPTLLEFTVFSEPESTEPEEESLLTQTS